MARTDAERWSARPTARATRKPSTACTCGVTLQTVQGPAKPSSAGMNTPAPVCQQRSGPSLVQVLPTGATGSAAAVSPKPARGNG